MITDSFCFSLFWFCCLISFLINFRYHSLYPSFINIYNNFIWTYNLKKKQWIHSSYDSENAVFFAFKFYTIISTCEDILCNASSFYFSPLDTRGFLQFISFSMNLFSANHHCVCVFFSNNFLTISLKYCKMVQLLSWSSLKCNMIIFMCSTRWHSFWWRWI